MSCTFKKISKIYTNTLTKFVRHCLPNRREVVMSEEKPLFNEQHKKDEVFFESIGEYLETARKFAKKQLDTTITVAYYEIGRMIVEHEQKGEKRAQYGARLIQELAEYLTNKYGKGFSVANLKMMRKFYQAYEIDVTRFLEIHSGSKNKKQSYFIEDKKGQTLSSFFELSWSHYQILTKIGNKETRNFYEVESKEQQWSVRELRRQVDSSLYERLLLSSDRNKIRELAENGQVVEKAKDLFKSPYVLEFTGLEQRSFYTESDLEQALIDNLQKFLLELGKGFLFEARQKRFSFDEKSFYVDLVFYNRLLQCYVIIDLKINELKHQDLGQMMMYVNYFDRHVKQEFEHPTIGILLCSQKDDAIFTQGQ